MKRLCVAGIIQTLGGKLLLGRRDKDPNRGKFVLPGGGVQDNETLEQALRREIKEETGLEITDCAHRWYRPNLIELEDRIIIVVYGYVDHLSTTIPISGDDLYDVQWFDTQQLPKDISPIIWKVLDPYGFNKKR